MVFDKWSGRARVTAVITPLDTRLHNTTLMRNESDLTNHILLVCSVVDHVTSVGGQSLGLSLLRPVLARGDVCGGGLVRSRVRSPLDSS